MVVACGIGLAACGGRQAHGYEPLPPPPDPPAAASDPSSAEEPAPVTPADPPVATPASPAVRSTLDRDVRALIAKSGELPIGTIIDSASFTDLGFDSLATVELTSALEDRFRIEISEEDCVHLMTVHDAIVFVTKYAAE